MGQLLIRSAKSSQKNTSPDTEDGYQYLFKAVQSGNVHQLKRFVDLKPGLKIEDIRKEGKSLLHTAVIHHQLDCMRYILELGLDANVQDSFGRSALIELIENKAKDRVCLASHNPRCLEIQLILLLKFKADINAISTVGRTALLKSIIYRHPLTELLLQHGADPNLADKDGLLPIHVCATYSCLQLLKQILKCGADINGQDSKGRTALYFSVLAGHQDIFNELISHQCDINKGSKYGFPLQTAVVKGRLEMVQALLQMGLPMFSLKFVSLGSPYSRT
ncbi:serine/threonine-protein phosphatase 6 regulatory ankyrin repeat subunit B-like, partial [Ruditapes philippinarum]|uniref:serine/threonine-protein phosphatase 6 regulatory ankyrin repeat subunit B-like n=1 Tax=Ruditapes philippinarum TaxID=129788 RepID=UPI00295AE27D